METTINENELTEHERQMHYEQMLLIQREMAEANESHIRETEEKRRNHEVQMEIRRVKTDMIKVATDTLAANARSKPVDTRDVTASDIKLFADELIQYINQE